VTRQAAFLAAYRQATSIAAAAKAVGIKPAQHYRWLAASAAYWEAFTDAQQEVTDTLHDQAVKRAMTGWAEPVLHRGRVIGTIQRHSDRLLIFILEAEKPEWRRYRAESLRGGPLSYERATPASHDSNA
jgi:hypothetical protein